MDIFSLGVVGLITFGGTWVVKQFFPKLDSKATFGVSIVVALVAGLIPADLGNEIVNRVKEAVGIATAVAGGFQILVKTAEKVG